MRITDCRNTTKSAVLEKQHNIWLGISLGNKYFNQAHLVDYITSLVDLSKNSLLIAIADWPQAINYQVFDAMPLATAQKKALRTGEQVFQLVKSIIETLPSSKQSKVVITKWDGFMDTAWYKDRYAVLSSAFESDSIFQEKILEIVKDNLGERTATLDRMRLIKLAHYIIQELPVFMGAVDFAGFIYDAHLYPGLSLMDDFILDLQAGRIFPEVAQQLLVTVPLVIIEAYAE
jgi:tRNA-dependent cyclodipeptide synthase